MCSGWFANRRTPYKSLQAQAHWARNPQEVSERVSVGLPAPRSKKCPKQSQDSSLLSLKKKTVFETLEAVQKTVSDTLGVGDDSGRLSWSFFGDYTGRSRVTQLR